MQNKYVSSYVFNKLKQIPFIETDDGYFTPDQQKLEPIFEEIAEDHENYEEVRDQLYELKFTEEELEAHMSLGQTLKTYSEWRDLFDEYLLNELYASNTKMDDEDDFEYRNGSSKPTTPTDGRVILNKRNPFADVSIQTQSFLYPGTKGFETLAFATNRHLIRKETEDGIFYAVVPGFKVTKTTEREQPNTIIASDSVSTKLPEQEGEKRVVYLN